MTFEETLDQAMAMLRRRGRVTYRTLKLHFQLDDEHLEALREALIEADQVAVDETGKILIWAPRAPAPPPASTLINVRSYLLLLLACVAGAVDAISYLGLGRVFTANMTGNTVLLGLAIGQEHTQAAIRSGLALAGFLTGVAFGAWSASGGRHDGVWASAVTASLALETILLVVFAVVWYLAGDPDTTAVATACLIVLSALAMGLQSAVARRLNIPGIATTYITGTLTSLIAGLVAELRRAPAALAAPEQTVRTAHAVESAPDTGLLAA